LAIGGTTAGARIQKAWLDREVVQCGYMIDTCGGMTAGVQRGYKLVFILNML
jgi:hypothetical protein